MAKSASKGMQGLGLGPAHAGKGPRSVPYQKGARAGTGNGGKSASPKGYCQPKPGKK